MAKLYIATSGCQMNVYDSERMSESLVAQGYRLCMAAADADVVILNTCHIREKAAEKLYSELGRLRIIRQQHRKQGRELLIVVAGCVAQAEGALVRERAPFVDLVVGPQAISDLPVLLGRLRRHRDYSGSDAAVSRLAVDFSVEAKFDQPRKPDLAGRGSAFLTVQEGCDKFCHFCVVPYTRGPEYSRPAGDILAEARLLIAAGAAEIVLLGQNVNSWCATAPQGGKDWRLARLIRALAELPGLARIRYTTSHPVDMDPDLIACHGEVPQLMPWLHLPVQSGSDRVLRAMNRRYSASQYHRIIDQLRDACPGIALSSDFIVAYPGEDADDFALTLDLIRRTVFSQSFSFIYSPRPGTPAASLQPVPREQARERLAELQALLNTQREAFHAKQLGDRIEVLVDGAGDDGAAWGYGPHMQLVHLPESASCTAGQLVTAHIHRAGRNSLGGVQTQHEVAEFAL